jgi:ribosomal protein S18 acetylase RimI-like enzyme
VSVRFLPLESGAVRRVLPFMARLYEQDHLDYDADRAVRVCEWFLANPDWGGVWMVESNGEDAGYLAITVASSIEFHGRLAFLDELYIAPAFRSRGLGPAAVEFASGWARARGFAALRLEVAHENAHAQHVYRRAGFLLQDDRRLMTKWLTKP